MSLAHESLVLQQTEKRRAAARLLGALLRGNRHSWSLCCREDIATHDPTEVIGPALAHAGLVEVTARCLGDSDATVRADVLDAEEIQKYSQTTSTLVSLFLNEWTKIDSALGSGTTRQMKR